MVTISTSRRRTVHSNNNVIVPPAQQEQLLNNNTRRKNSSSSTKKKKKKKQKIQRLINSRICFVCIIVTSFMLLYYYSNINQSLLQLISTSSNEKIIFSDTTSQEYQDLYHERHAIVAQHKNLYRNVYETKDQKQTIPMSDKTTNNNNNNDNQLQTFKYGESITSCNVTFVLMDPRIAFPITEYGPGQPIWFSLESVAAFAPVNSCVILQTAPCAMRDYLEIESTIVTNDQVVTEIINTIYYNSFPLFRQMINSGYVRLTLLDYEKYNLQSCHNFGNPTPAFINWHYWNDEFIENIDSDYVIIIQDDSVLCHPIQINEWKHYAYVGGVWTKHATPLTPEPMEGACMAMPSRWNSWILPQRRWQKQQQEQQQKQQQEQQINNDNNNVNKIPPIKKVYPKPDILVPNEFSVDICNDGNGPIGNGGLSFRNRNWMKRVIETCPQILYSGLNNNNDNDDNDNVHLACKVIDSCNEDFYFGVVLRGLGAPLPPAFIASLFSTEMLWPNETLLLYGKPMVDTTTATTTISNNNNDGKEKETVTDSNNIITQQHGEVSIQINNEMKTIPTGFHKPWWYHPNNLLRSKPISVVCPFLQYVFEPSMSRWKEYTSPQEWSGVGK